MHGLTGVFRTLAEQHGEVSALMRRVVGHADKRMDLWPKIRQELLSHERGELDEVYPALRQFAETRGLADRHQQEAGELSSLIEQINRATPASDEWSRFFEQLVTMVEQHAEEEERDIFPKAQKVLGPDRAKQLEPRFLAAKKSAVSHPV